MECGGGAVAEEKRRVGVWRINKDWTNRRDETM